MGRKLTVLLPWVNKPHLEIRWVSESFADSKTLASLHSPELVLLVSIWHEVCFYYSKRSWDVPSESSHVQCTL